MPQVDGLPVDGDPVPAQGFELDPAPIPKFPGCPGAAVKAGGRRRLQHFGMEGEGRCLPFGQGGDVPGLVPVHLDHPVGRVKIGA